MQIKKAQNSKKKIVLLTSCFNNLNRTPNEIRTHKTVKVIGA